MDRGLRGGDSELPSLVHGQGSAACSRPVQQPNDCRPSLCRRVGNQHLVLRATALNRSSHITPSETSVLGKFSKGSARATY